MIRRALLAVGVLLVLVGIGMDPNDDLEKDQALYCQMVSEGSWPDYELTAGEYCK